MRMHQRPRPGFFAFLTPIALAAALLLSGAGCYGYAYHRRGPGPTFGKVAIDPHKPESTVRWSLFWGLRTDEWLPVDCAPSAKGLPCKPIKDICDGKGAGRVEVKFVWYSALTMIFTLGMAVPNKVIVYCSTDEGPDTDPFAEGPE